MSDSTRDENLQKLVALALELRRERIEKEKRAAEQRKAIAEEKLRAPPKDAEESGTPAKVIESEAVIWARELAHPPRRWDPPPGWNLAFTMPSTKECQLPDRSPNVTIAEKPSSEDQVVYQEDLNRWTACIEVDPKRHGYLIGASHATRKMIEKETQCRINIPPKEAKSSLINLSSGAGRDNVVRCLDRIKEIVTPPIRASRNATHFAAFPLNSRDIVSRFCAFQEMIMECRNVAHESCKQPVLFPSKMKLHLTIAMLSINTVEKVNAVRKILGQLNEKHKSKFPMEVKIAGLDTAGVDHAKVHVLFAKVHGDELREVAEDMRSEFARAGLVSRDQPIRMHMTVMNSRYATSKDENGNYIHQQRKTFDATSLLETHGDFDFSNFILDRMTICTIDSVDERTGYYECFMEQKLNVLES